ncbi:MAG: hypothetical protein KF716_33385 [Anaerolineae bacterium]|nr:hypothetical protein [Anaerolineae bacterium]
MPEFASVLDVFRRTFPAGLVSAEAVRQLAEAVGDLPDALSAGYILECRLNDDAHVDLGIVVDPAINQGRSLLSGSELPERVQIDPIWQRIATFARQWTDEQSPVHEQIATIWLEFDIDGTLHPRPSFFFGPHPDTWKKIASQATSDSSFQALIEPLRMLLPTLGGTDLLEGCFSSVPKNAEVFQLGLMLPRGSNAVRLCVRGKPDAELMRYLPRIGWEGDATNLHAVLIALAGLVDNIGLDADVGTSIGKRIGIECRFDQWRQPTQEPRWKAFLDYLVSIKVCTTAKRDALLAWPSTGYHRFPEDRLPRVLIRALNHIKIVIEPEKPLEAKAYLWFGTRSADYMKARQEGRNSG